MFKSHQIKSKHRVLSKKEVDSYGAPVFAPDYGATVFAAKMCTESNEHSMYDFYKFLLCISYSRLALPNPNILTHEGL